MTSAVLLPFGLLGAYVAGSINFSIILFRLLGRCDPRTQIGRASCRERV